MIGLSDKGFVQDAVTSASSRSLTIIHTVFRITSASLGSVRPYGPAIILARSTPPWWGGSSVLPQNDVESLTKR